MASIGSFGAALREFEPDGERDTFEFFGETFTVHGVIPGMVLVKCCAGIAGQLGGIEEDAVLFEALRCALTKPGDKPDRSEWDRFYALAVARKCGGEALAGLAMGLMGAQAGKDLEQSPTSADGSQPTSTSSNTPASDSPA